MSRYRVLVTSAVLNGLSISVAFAQSVGVYLGELSWTDAERRFQDTPVVVVPFGGGAKEHGPHLPMNADQKVMEYLCQQAVDSADVIVVPPILHGWFAAFRGYPGTEVADPDVFERYVFEVAMSLVQQGAQRIVFLNTGIAKATGLPISIAAREIRTQTGTPTLVVSWDDLETTEIEALRTELVGGHGGELETSIHLYLQPELVHMDRAVTDYGESHPKNYPGYQPGRFSRDRTDPGFSETGILGDPTLADAEKGRRALEILTRQWLLALRGFAETAIHR